MVSLELVYWLLPVFTTIFICELQGFAQSLNYPDIRIQQKTEQAWEMYLTITSHHHEVI